MKVTFAPRDILQIDDARIIYRNLAGVGSKYNRDGDRNFAVVIPDQELANSLLEKGWNVKIKPPRDEEEDPFIYLPVKVKFNDAGPHIYVQSGRSLNKLNEDSVGMIDDLEIRSVDLDIRPYDWDVNDKSGRTAYLQSMKVVQNIDRFAAEFAEQESPAE